MSASNSFLPRYEIKFIAESLQYNRILCWLHQHQSCLQTEYPDRQVNNVYFDSFTHHSYSQNIIGSSSKSKIRLRWYGASKNPEKSSLEIKCKRNQLNWKLIYKMQGELGLDDWSWKRITSEIRRQLPLGAKKWVEMYPQPVLINRYVRKYFISRDKKVRVTLDKNLDIYDQSRKSFPNYSSKSNMPNVLVLEVKFPREMRDHVAYRFGDIPLRGSRFSKYVSGFFSINS